MARERMKERKYPYGGGRVEGNLAYDYDYERRARRPEQHRAPAPAAQTAHRKEQNAAPQTTVRTRPRQKVSVAVLAGFSVLAVAVFALIMSYAQLAEISSNVVSMKSELTALQDEHVILLTRYEKAFDLTTIKEAAEKSGMAKPSASQICYVDLSGPDNVTVYQTEESVLSRTFASLGHGMCSVAEYFK